MSSSRRHNLTFCHGIIGALAIAVLPAQLLAAEFELGWSTLDSGGVMNATDGVYTLSATIGQPDATAVAMTGDGYTLVGGFWAGVPAYEAGDLNCDGVTDLFDIDPFVLVLTSATDNPPFAGYYAVYPDCDPALADTDASGSVDLFDIDAFVDLLTGG